MMLRYYMRVFGRVQGVGFRYFVQYTASLLNLTGWVRNLDDDSVEMEVQGQEEVLNAFINKIRKGNGFSRVEDFSIHKLPLVDEEKSFKIKY